MSAQTIIAIVAVAVVFVFAIVQVRRGPLVMQIDHAVRKNRKDQR